MLSSLQFLGQAMAVMSRKNPLTESFMAQLDVDLEGSDISMWPRKKYMEQVNLYQNIQRQAKPAGAMHGVGTSPTPAEIPVNTDTVKCSPLFEIRDSQGMTGADRSVFYSKESSSSFGGQMLDIDSYAHLSPETMQFQLPNRSKGSPYGPKLNVMEQVPTPTSEMDFSTTDPRHQKSRSNSYKDTSSHTSFTPPTGDATSVSGLSKSSPGTLDGSSTLPTPSSVATAAGPDALFFDMADASFSNFQQSQFFAVPGPAAFTSPATQPGPDIAMSSAGWEMGGIEATSTGLTPMATESWSDVLSGVADWGGVPAEHQGFGARSRGS
jgi:hypothetical protein